MQRPPSTLSNRASAGETVNDRHSRLNLARVLRVERPASPAAMRRVLSTARTEGLPLSTAGGRHAMGGQQFLHGGVLVDTTGMRRVLGLDREAGLVEVEAASAGPSSSTGLSGRSLARAPDGGSARSRPAPTG